MPVFPPPIIKPPVQTGTLDIFYVTAPKFAAAPMFSFTVFSPDGVQVQGYAGNVEKDYVITGLPVGTYTVGTKPENSGWFAGPATADVTANKTTYLEIQLQPYTGNGPIWSGPPCKAGYTRDPADGLCKDGHGNIQPITGNGGGITLPAGGGPVGTGSSTLTIIVDDAKTRAFISGASIVLQEALGSTTIATSSTDQNGQCVLSQLADGFYNVTVNAAGYTAGGGSINVSGDTKTTFDLSPTGITPPPVGCGPFPTFPSLSLDIGTYLNYLASVIGWAACQTWVYATQQIPALQNLDNFLSTGWTDFLKGVNDFLTGPEKWLTSVFNWLTTEHSPSPISGMMEYMRGAGSTLGSNAAGSATVDNSPAALFKKNFDDMWNRITAGFGDMIPPDDSETVAKQIQDEFLGLSTLMVAVNFAIECLPLEDYSGFAFLLAQIMSQLGFSNFMGTTLTVPYQMNVLRPYTDRMNLKYRNALPDLSVILSEFIRGNLSTTDFDTMMGMKTGCAQIDVDRIYRSTLNFPAFEEFVTYNRRHPNDKFDLTDIGAKVRLDMKDFGKVFLERQYSEIPIRSLRTIYLSGQISDSDVQLALRRHGYREDLLDGQSKSDFQVMYDYVTAGLEFNLNKQLLASVERLYYQGTKTDSDLMQAASLVYTDPTELQTYLQTAANKKALKDSRPKHFTYTQLIKFAESGIDISKIVDGDLAATGLDATHQQIARDYITTTLQAKGTTVSGGS